MLGTAVEAQLSTIPSPTSMSKGYVPAQLPVQKLFCGGRKPTFRDTDPGVGGNDRGSASWLYPPRAPAIQPVLCAALWCCSLAFASSPGQAGLLAVAGRA